MFYKGEILRGNLLQNGEKKSLWWQRRSGAVCPHSTLCPVEYCCGLCALCDVMGSVTPEASSLNPSLSAW